MNIIYFWNFINEYLYLSLYEGVIMQKEMKHIQNINSRYYFQTLNN